MPTLAQVLGVYAKFGALSILLLHYFLLRHWDGGDPTEMGFGICGSIEQWSNLFIAAPPLCSRLCAQMRSNVEWRTAARGTNDGGDAVLHVHPGR